MQNNEFKGRSLAIGDESIAVGRLPGRKQVALYQVRGSVLEPLAYFKTEEKARATIDWLMRLAGAVGATWNPKPPELP